MQVGLLFLFLIKENSKRLQMVICFVLETKRSFETLTSGAPNEDIVQNHLT